MKKKILNTVLIIAVFAIAIGCGAYSLLYDTQSIEGQEKIAQSTSPNEKYIVTAYLNNGESEDECTVLCRLTNLKLFGRDRNVYLQKGCKEAEMEWKDETTIVINGKEIDVRFETYDYRKEK